MTDRLTDDQLGWFDRYIRPGYDEMASGDDMLALVAEVREHRARWNDVRIVHSGDTVPLTTYHEALHRIREALDTNQ